MISSKIQVEAEEVVLITCAMAEGGGGAVMSVFDWMTQTKLKLNQSKTEFLLIGCENSKTKFSHIPPSNS